ncbi:uncharacterized protein EMH_0044730 [Eimeria mitis]|uniref:SET domain-containing protein n=1 Tax=Eimeria mitis TaxID=44415 RepID=U6JZF0_9EIME|nr:uncharacterized protein EMH_0044730 [Eimeria mitis]CDJ28878.1 hypothetical protein, conserved [Eimeria mitis]
MNSRFWFAFIGCLLTLNTSSVLAISTPPSSHHSFLSFQFRPPASHANASLGRSTLRLRSVHSGACSGVSTPAEEKPRESGESVDLLFLKLKKWLACNGADLDIEGLALRHHDDSEYETFGGEEKRTERYLTAQRQYPRGSVIASIPSSLHFTSEILEQLHTRVVGERRNTPSNEENSASNQPAFSRAEKELDASDGGLLSLCFGERKTDATVRLSFLLAAFQELFAAKDTNILRSTSPLNSSFFSHSSSLLQGWLLYMQLLPPPNPSIPLFWNSEELRALRHPIMHAVFARLQCLYTSLRSHGHLFQVGGPPGAPRGAPGGAPQSPSAENSQLFKRLVAAHATANSKALRLPADGCAFVPLVDMCVHATHSPNARLKLKSESSSSCSSTTKTKTTTTTAAAAAAAGAAAGVDGKHSNACRTNGVSVQLVALRDIKKDECISISFGSKLDNPTLLLNYGLLPKDNP